MIVFWEGKFTFILGWGKLTVLLTVIQHNCQYFVMSLINQIANFYI